MSAREKETAPISLEEIALWGPYGSGKSWLLRSFAKELEYYNRLNDQEKDFFYELGEFLPGEQDPRPVISEPPINIAPAFKLITFKYRFKRVPRTLDRRHRISAQDHEVILNKFKWKDLVQGLDDPENYEYVMTTYVQSQNHIIALGIPYEKMAHELAIEFVPDQPSSIGFSRKMGSELGVAVPSQEELVISMQRLLEKIGTRKRCNLAVCLTRADQLDITGSPWSLLEYRHGRPFRQLLESYQKIHNIEVFITSAAGYLREKGRSLPNFMGGSLLDPERWQPFNTAAPFFWIFEQVERARLRDSSIIFRGAHLREYIPYPRPRAI